MHTLILWALACDRPPPSSTPTFIVEPSPSPVPDPVPDPGEDADGDGAAADVDCDDADPTRYPGAIEGCDGVDNDCDGVLHPHEASGGLFAADVDGLDCAVCDDLGWWSDTLEVSPSGLAALVRDLTSDHDCFNYSAATDYMFLNLDADAGQVECVYTGRRTSLASGKPDPADMNTEHSWPQSLGAGDEPARCDLHHLFPTDADTNNARGNLPFGQVQADTQVIDGGSRLGRDASGTTVFEPRDAHKGNVARAMLYFAAQYGHPLSNAEIALYQDWSARDPVDAAEIDRTLQIEDRQGAANPYVACPWLVEVP